LNFIKNIFTKQSPQEEREYNVKSFSREQLIKEEDDKRRRIEEREHRGRIYKLWSDNASFRDYMIESQKFNNIYGKNVKCDICGWNCGLEAELYIYNGQTYCELYIPVSS